MSYYRIGTFAQKLGVTPDFLKYYEKMGVLQPEIKGSGYRYYSFAQCKKVFECVKLRNCGLSSREVIELMSAPSFSSYVEKISARQQELSRQARFYLEVLRVNSEMERVQKLFCSENNWEVRESAGYYFLPYSVRDHLMDDPAVSHIVRNWLSWLPVVRSCTKYTVAWPAHGQLLVDAASAELGFAVEKSFAAEQGLLLESPVEDIPPRRCLMVYTRSKNLGRIAQSEEERAHNPTNIVRRILAKYGFTVMGDCLSLDFATLNEPDGYYNYAAIQVPIQ